MADKVDFISFRNTNMDDTGEPVLELYLGEFGYLLSLNQVQAIALREALQYHEEAKATWIVEQVVPKFDTITQKYAQLKRAVLDKAGVATLGETARALLTEVKAVADLCGPAVPVGESQEP